MNISHVYEGFQAAPEVEHTERLSARVLAALRIWIQRSRGRESLRELDERLLQDIGVRHDEALLEARKPFWKP
jgi:uncharacterized protein YjiS (DUF1127 family)